MQITSSIETLRQWLKQNCTQNGLTGFVPTMGALHQGHISLINRSVDSCERTVVSIFVNRIQFNDKNDYNNYPNTLSEDLQKCSQAGVNYVFVPDESVMYNNHKTYIDVTDLTDNLCGKHRPGHFKGVFTVVSKLFNIVQPDMAFFGRKDLQQALAVRKMVCDLNFPIKIIICPTIREKDGLALSSRNVHLDTKQRERALSIYKSLMLAKKMILDGTTDLDLVCASINDFIVQNGFPESIDYITAVNIDSLEPVSILDQDSAIALAANFGSVRLIDNMIIYTDGDTRCDL
ncbi:MAG: pantoate--beta-alanine ligase [Spirochaetes bacterium]|nr:pantoate--beta-alanine ligase [Spirochaetota bacterium]